MGIFISPALLSLYIILIITFAIAAILHSNKLTKLEEQLEAYQDQEDTVREEHMQRMIAKAEAFFDANDLDTINKEGE